jgi:hypothetical protein
VFIPSSGVSGVCPHVRIHAKAVALSAASYYCCSFRMGLRQAGCGDALAVRFWSWFARNVTSTAIPTPRNVGLPPFSGQINRIIPDGFRERLEKPNAFG